MLLTYISHLLVLSTDNGFSLAFQRFSYEFTSGQINPEATVIILNHSVPAGTSVIHGGFDKRKKSGTSLEVYGKLHVFGLNLALQLFF